MITGCWIATHIISVYSNVGNPQLFFTSCTGVEVFCSAASIVHGGNLMWYPFMSSTCSNTFFQIKYFIVYTLGSGLCLYINCTKMKRLIQHCKCYSLVWRKAAIKEILAVSFSNNFSRKPVLMWIRTICRFDSVPEIIF